MKTPSASNASLPELTYFVDRDLGNHLFPDALEASGLRVVRYSDHFNETTKDEEWLPRVGAEGWIALTHDRRISKNSLLVGAAMRAGVRLFILRGKSPTRALADNFLQVRRRVELLVSRNDGPFIAKVYIAKDQSRRAIREAVQMYLSELD